MASRPSHIYASTARRRDRAWGRGRRRIATAAVAPLGATVALTCSTLLGMAIQHFA